MMWLVGYGCHWLVIQYRVLVFPRLKLSGGGSTTANCWLSIAGQYGETEEVQLPKHTLDITIKVLTSSSCVVCVYWIQEAVIGLSSGDVQ